VSFRQQQTAQTSKAKKFHGIAEWLWLKAISGGHLVHPLLKPGHLKKAAQDCVWTAFEYLQGWRQLLWAASLEKVFPDAPVFQFGPLPLALFVDYAFCIADRMSHAGLRSLALSP